MSDKTGTLTCNKMIFKEIVIGKLKYSGAFQKNNSLMNKANSVQSLINEQRKTRSFRPFNE